MLFEDLSLYEREVLIFFICGLLLLEHHVCVVEGLFLVVVRNKLVSEVSLVLSLLFFLLHDLLVDLLQIVIFSFQLNFSLRGFVGHVVPDLFQMLF